MIGASLLRHSPLEIVTSALSVVYTPQDGVCQSPNKGHHSQLVALFKPGAPRPDPAWCLSPDTPPPCRLRRSWQGRGRGWCQVVGTWLGNRHEALEFVDDPLRVLLEQ